MAIVFLTPEGLDRFKNELDHIKSVKLPQAERRYAAAKEYGYAENDFEYTDSKSERDFYIQRIAYLTNSIETAKII